jgi:serine/threonine protein kinase
VTRLYSCCCTPATRRATRRAPTARWAVWFADAGTVELRRNKDALGALSGAELEAYRGDATWCCTMPSGFVVVRRVLDGGRAATRPTVQGNSQKGDIFSFGMTMWETLKREQPYSGEKHRKLKKPEFEEVRERGELPGELSEIEPLDVRELVSKMLSFDHEARPSAEECARMIQVIRARLPPV